MTSKTIIHEKLEVMKQCYIQRDLKNLDLIIDTFFHPSRPAIVVGTDNGEWFRTMDQFRELFIYDWQHWGDVIIDTFGFEMRESEHYIFTRVRAILDFHEYKAWDLDILMIFEPYEDDLVCRMMQFKVPRNVLRPTVIINRSDDEQSKYETEIKDLNQMSAGNGNSDLTRTLIAMLEDDLVERRPDWDEIQIPENQIVICSEEGKQDFYFACTGLCTVEKDRLPFRIIGLGCQAGADLRIIDCELSLPFFCELG
ncbi:MAG: hypothetical protein IJJ01_11000 [Firmicutes bacterium]|nr:hypothetical protein [Bacillota bacterium]